MLTRWRKGKTRGILRDALLVVAIIFFEPYAPMFCVGLGVFLLGAGLHFWSKGCLARNAETAPSGPYRLVRHPFYLANALLDLGICFMSGSFFLVVLYPLAFALTYVPVILHEEQYLAQSFSESYLRYKQRVPAMIPCRLPYEAGGAGFRWQNIVRENEMARLLRLLAMPSYFLIFALLFHDVLPTGSISTGALCVALGWAILLNLFGILAGKWRGQRLRDHT